MAVKKCFSIIGYHNSGKTSLIVEMISLLLEKGYSVSTVKHASHLKLEEKEPLKDSEALFLVGSEKTVALSERCALIYSRSESLRSVLSSMASDVVILEGFKEAPFPNIVRAKNLSEAEELISALTVACVLDDPSESGLAGVPIFSPVEAEKVLEVALQRSFPPLPLFDCGRCGEKNCREMAIAILRGKRKYEDCVVLPSRVSLRVNGVEIPMKPFVENLFVAVVRALIGTLKETPEEMHSVELKLNL